MAIFADTFSGFTGETIEVERNGLRIVATIHQDNDADAPWDGSDMHGEAWDGTPYAAA